MAQLEALEAMATAHAEQKGKRVPQRGELLARAVVNLGRAFRHHVLPRAGIDPAPIMREAEKQAEARRRARSEGLHAPGCLGRRAQQIRREMDGEQQHATPAEGEARAPTARQTPDMRAMPPRERPRG